MGKVTRYSYVQIESAVKVNAPKAGGRRPAAASGYFTMALNFYNKDLDANKKKIIQFTIKEHDEDDEEEESKSFTGHQPGATVRLSNVTLQGIVTENEGMAPLEFSVIYMIQRQLPIFW